MTIAGAVHEMEKKREVKEGEELGSQRGDTEHFELSASCPSLPARDHGEERGAAAANQRAPSRQADALYQSVRYITPSRVAIGRCGRRLHRLNCGSFGCRAAAAAGVMAAQQARAQPAARPGLPRRFSMRTPDPPAALPYGAVLATPNGVGDGSFGGPSTAVSVSSRGRGGARR